MPGAHRQDDLRNCSGKTVVTGQDFVSVNGKLWAVEDDQDDHIHGELVSASPGTVFINGKKVIVLTDHAKVDAAGHPPPTTYPATASLDVSVY
jgi:hypothetical protein